MEQPAHQNWTCHLHLTPRGVTSSIHWHIQLPPAMEPLLRGNRFVRTASPWQRAGSPCRQVDLSLAVTFTAVAVSSGR